MAYQFDVAVMVEAMQAGEAPGREPTAESPGVNTRGVQVGNDATGFKSPRGLVSAKMKIPESGVW